ncbi:hypothetical protein T4E_10340 [Trichinella pseudospiralis]|uniref:Uncharacterized protein n=1 Tax=Trichinella pseudospiralis TaxID=6337 RepID=A0A0V0XEH9_TRIPS|nr:hypothetical protein T4E_10340 [Trichinella pseudospiralis]KRY91232.1 hypothetical protein T4D_10240 [Trichinella pseudospiralis]
MLMLIAAIKDAEAKNPQQYHTQSKLVYGLIAAAMSCESFSVQVELLLSEC